MNSYIKIALLALLGAFIFAKDGSFWYESILSYGLGFFIHRILLVCMTYDPCSYVMIPQRICSITSLAIRRSFVDASVLFSGPGFSTRPNIVISASN